MIGSMIQSIPSEPRDSLALSRWMDGSRSFASSLFIQRQPPAVLEPTYACSTFMDNCTPISLSKPKARGIPASSREISRRGRSAQGSRYKISRIRFSYSSSKFFYRQEGVFCTRENFYPRVYSS